MDGGDDEKRVTRPDADDHQPDEQGHYAANEARATRCDAFVKG
jgi:hypothetical protein